jgi:hypothetical protein
MVLLTCKPLGKCLAERASSSKLGATSTTEVSSNSVTFGSDTTLSYRMRSQMWKERCGFVAASVSLSSSMRLVSRHRARASE